MSTFRVWAPLANEVELESESGRAPMTRGERGYWTAESDALDYAYCVDGSAPRPDPRSMRQPQGVHGRSRRVDHRAFRWNDAGFSPTPLRDAVLYELHVGTFSPEGTFDGVIGKLDHLGALGVTHVELMPVNAFAGERGWGYDGVALFAPHEVYGGPEGLKRLVDACHARGLSVALDVVYNHLGPAGNYLELFGPYFTEKFQTPWGKAVNLCDEYSDPVREFIVDNVRLWFEEYHFDVLRLDAVHALYDTSAMHILEELAIETERLSQRLGKPLVLIAESDLNDPRVVQSRSAGGLGIDAQWSDDLHHSIHALLTGERVGYYSDFGSLSEVAKALGSAFVYEGQHAPHRKRRHGRAIGALPGDRFLAYSQTHDQVGNRAAGERLCQLVSLEKSEIAAALTLFGPYVPMLFQGEEWAASTPFQYFTDHEPELGKLVSEGRRREFSQFGWRPEEVPDPQERSTFERSKLEWGETSVGVHASMIELYRRLIDLRRSAPTLRDPDRSSMHVEFDEAARWLRVDRVGYSMVVNLGPSQEVPCASGRIVLEGRISGARFGAAGLATKSDAFAIVETRIGT